MSQYNQKVITFTTVFVFSKKDCCEVYGFPRATTADRCNISEGAGRDQIKLRGSFTNCLREISS